MPTFEKRGIYHSNLVGLDGPVWLMFNSDPLLSKNKTDHYVAVNVADAEGVPEEGDHWLTLEHDGIKDFVESLPKKEWVYVEASGSRETAILRRLNTDGSVHSESGVSGPSAPVVPKAPVAPKAPVPVQPSAGESLADAEMTALKHAVAIVMWFKGEFGEEPSDAILRVASNLFIEHNKSGKPI